MQFKEIMNRLGSLKDPEAVEGMARFGINPENNLGISVTTLRKMARKIGRDHQLAQKLWSSGLRDAKMLACLIDEPRKVTEEQMERWVEDFNSWDVCDTCCGFLFAKTKFVQKMGTDGGGPNDDTLNEFMLHSDPAFNPYEPNHNG